uniref:Uncharacterized protein n=1 Tax=Aegilops tauschii TaxID=37682 RepID=M8AV41_AEGTA
MSGRAGRLEPRDVLHGHILDKEFTIREICKKVRWQRDKYRSMQADVASGASLRGNAEDLKKYEIFDKIWGDSPPFPNDEEIKGNAYQTARPRVRGDFEELRDVYRHLTLAVGKIFTDTDEQDPLKRAFELIDDAKACDLNEKVKKQRVLEIKA